MASETSVAHIQTRETSRPDAWALREQRLVAAARRGHVAAFDELCQPYTGRLRHMTLRITRNKEDSEDAVQDSLMRAFVYIRNFDGRSSFSTWLTRIATNSALMILRKRRTSGEMALDEREDEDVKNWIYQVADHRPDPESRYAEREQAEILHGAIERLRPKLRRVVELQQLQENSLTKTATTLGISLTATKGRLFHARAALRKSAKVVSIRQRGMGRRMWRPQIPLVRGQRSSADETCRTFGSYR